MQRTPRSGHRPPGVAQIDAGVARGASDAPGWSSSVHASPRPKSIHSPVPVKPVWPMVSSRSTHRRPASRVARFPAQRARGRLAGSRLAQAVLSLQQIQRRVQHAIDGAEQPGMAAAPPECKSVFVMHFTAHHPAAPDAALGRGGIGRVGVARRNSAGNAYSPSTRPRQPLDGDTEEHEIDVGIDRRTGLPCRCRMKARSVPGFWP